MADKHVPLLIPQAWIQWHSLLKKDLVTQKSPMAGEFYRVDFVAFGKIKDTQFLLMTSVIML